jgi:hypothetical protein
VPNQSRGRLTVPDIVLFLASMAFLAPLSLVYFEALDTNAHLMSTGEAYLYQMIAPLAVLVLFSMIFVKAIGGGA